FSSAQSFWPNAGQCNYAAACSFQDAYGHYLATVCGLPVRILNWGLWGEVGVAGTADRGRRFHERGILSIGKEEGMIAMERGLASSTVQVVAIKARRELLEQLGIELT